MSTNERINPAAMTVAESAEYMAISRATLYRLLEGGDLPSGYIGRRRILFRKDLDSFLATIIGFQHEKEITG